MSGNKKFQTRETDRGVLKYRMPNAIEIYDIIEACSFSNGKTSIIQSKKNVMLMLDRYLDYSGIEGVESYDQLLEDVEVFTIPLSEIVDEILSKVAVVFTKKN